MQHRLGLVCFFALTSCSGEKASPALYGHDQCMRVAVVDSETGAPILGAEDFAVDWQKGRLFISAYDRRAVEKAVRNKAASLPGGGVYKVLLPEIFENAGKTIKATPLVAASDIAGGLRPHGISYDAANHELVFVNRAYTHNGKKWRMTPHIQRVGANGEMFVGEIESAPCAANDVLVTAETTLTTFDHSACDWRMGFENLFNLKRSGIADSDGVRIYQEAGFANGLAETLDSQIAMAATREKVLLFFDYHGTAITEKRRVALPGAPDNLTLAHDGGVVAAVHPSLMRLALNRKLGIGRAPSRIVKTDPDNGAVEVLFDDPAGKLFSAATVAVETKDGLVAGSVTDDGILVCRGGL